MSIRNYHSKSHLKHSSENNDIYYGLYTKDGELHRVFMCDFYSDEVCEEREECTFEEARRIIENGIVCLCLGWKEQEDPFSKEKDEYDEDDNDKKEIFLGKYNISDPINEEIGHVYWMVLGKDRKITIVMWFKDSGYFIYQANISFLKWKDISHLKSIFILYFNG